MEVSQPQGRRLSAKEEEAILNALRSGASPHMIARSYQLTMEQAVAYAEALANETKSGGVSHRILLRSLLREQAASAVRTVREVMEGVRRDAHGNLVNILATKEDREIAMLRLKAAESMLKNAQRFIDEDVVRGFIEQPAANAMQETIFDFESQVRDDGSTVLVVRPSLAVLQGGEAG